MSRPTKLIPLALALLASCAVYAPAASAQRIDPGAAITSDREFAPGEAIVRYRPGTDASERRATRSAAGVDFERGVRVRGVQVVDVDKGVGAAVERLERQPRVAYAQPNYRYEALAVPPPDDTFFGSLWGLEDPAAPDPGVDALEAWETTRGAGTVIAILDTGVDLTHPDLVDNLWSGLGGVHGHDFVDGDSDPDDFHYHGTHVAGTAAARDENTLGIAGVAPDAQIMAVRVLDGNGSGKSDDIAAGIEYAAQQGADVINLSLGGPAGDGDQLMSDAVDVADQQDAVVAAAAGNSANDNDVDPTTPCTLPQPNLICVAAVNRSGGLAGFSNFGATTVDVGGPGTGILSAEPAYDVLYEEDFETSIGGTWTLEAPWERTDEQPSEDGEYSLADSPGTDYGANLNIWAEANDSVDFGDGCRASFEARLDIDDAVDTDDDYLDRLIVGVETVGGVVGLQIAGSTDGAFEHVDTSLPNLDGLVAANPVLGFQSNDTVFGDGAHVDDLTFLCRNHEVSPPGDYVFSSGTSMATPHVAGVAALVRAAAPAESDTEIVEAIKAGGAPLSSLAGKTVTGCTVDAATAIAVALGAPDPELCPAPPSPLEADPPSDSDSDTPTDDGSAPPPDGGSDPPSDDDDGVTSSTDRLGRADLRDARRRIRARRRGFVYRFDADPDARGVAVFRTLRRAVVARVRARVPARRRVRRRHVRLARDRFTVRAAGRVRLRVLLGSRARRVLRLNRRLRLVAIVRLRDDAGRRTTARKRLVLVAPRHRVAPRRRR